MGKLAHSGLKSKAGDVVENVAEDGGRPGPLNQTLARAKENGVQDWFHAATHNFKTYEHRWETG